LGLAVAIPANLLLIALGRPIIRIWVGPQIVPSFLLLTGLATWAILSGIGGPMAMFLNGIGFIRVQAICSVLMALGNVPLSIYLTRHIGVSGAIYGSITSQILFILSPYFWYLRRLMSDT
jgi:O-antigen/teichoic acid export membrane protein